MPSDKANILRVSKKGDWTKINIFFWILPIRETKEEFLKYEEDEF
jgi:hypothetical protein